jgi:aldose 1-epimerase
MKINTRAETLQTLPNGQELIAYTLEAENGLKAVVLNFGGILDQLWVPNADGECVDILLGMASAKDYIDSNPNYFGAMIGPFANRIAGSRFSLDDQEFSLTANEGANQLHGGPNGIHQKFWKGEFTERGALQLSTMCPDGEDGFPGEREISVLIELTPENGLLYSTIARTSEPTVINITAHPYFNLSGQGSGSIAGHVLEMNADYYLPVDNNGVPTGELCAVEGTAFDFRQPAVVGERLLAEDPQIKRGGGFDHTFVFAANRDPKAPVARLSDPKSGRKMEIYTSEPGVQFYTGNTLQAAETNKSPYQPHAALCLETQHFPDSPNQPNFPSTALYPGDVFASFTELRFG